MTDLARRLAGLPPEQRAALEARLRERTAARPGIPCRADGGPAPLSFGQERLWFLHQLDPGDAAYNIPLVRRLRGPLDGERLAAALAEVVSRHASLRTRYATVDGRPVQIVEDVALEVEHVDVSTEDEARALVAERTNRPFDLSRPVVPRATLIRLADDDHILCLVIHHISADGWSLDVLGRELASLGRGEPLAPLALQYVDYAAWSRGTSDGLAYWREQLADVPPLLLPTDRPRPPVKTTHGAYLDHVLPVDLSSRIVELAAAERCTLFMAMLAAYTGLVSRLTGQADFAVGSPIAGRLQPEVEPLIGFFVNTLVLRADLTGDPTFRELLARTRSTALQAYDQQSVPFDRLVGELDVDRDLSRTPLFQTLFSLRLPDAGGFAWPGVASEPVDPDFRHVKFDLSVECRQEHGRLALVFAYNTDLFDEATIEALAHRFERFLAGAVVDPDTRLSALPLLSDDERHVLLTAPDPPSTADTTLNAVVTAQAQRTPEAVALVEGDDQVTYRELVERASGLATALRDHGVGPERVVGVCLDRSLDVAVAMLAVMEAGGAYLPLDPELPPERRRFMLDDAGAVALVSEEGITGFGSAPAPAAARPDNLAYVIYTSGSTGQPKGVGVQHRQILNYLDDIARRLDVPPGAHYGLLQSLAFDFGLTMLYLALATGGTLHLLPRRITGPELADQLRARPLDYLKLTPSHLAVLGPEIEPRRALLLGGEGFDVSLVAELGVRVVNHYGPTEATVGVTTWDVDPSVRGAAPIGRPLDHARVHVLDEHLQLVPPGVTGEVCIGGDRLARGYLRRPGLTAERFVPDPFGPPGSRLYRTGDLGRRLPDGQLAWLGRKDLQVKIRGYRVELGEVEAALGRCPGVEQAVVASRDGELVAYLVGAEPRPVSELRRELAVGLPDYMVPARYVWLDELPLKAHGKVDRAALPEPESARPDQDVGYQAPDGPIEQAIATVWSRALGIEQVGVLDDFFDLGGHSLLAAQVVAQVAEALPAGAHRVGVMDLFQHPTVRGLAELAASGSSAGLLYELTPPTPAGERVRSYVCVPFGGGSAVAYQPLADALPAGNGLFAVALPGHDLGLGGEVRPMDEVAAEATAEILDRVDGPLVLYGHCGVGGALAVEIARRVRAAGRPLEAVYLGGVFPFARPGGRLARLFRLERFRSDRIHVSWLKSLGADLDGFTDDQVRFIVRAMRHDALVAEDYFTDLTRQDLDELGAPVISVVGERDPGTEYYAERFTEWHFLSDVTGLAVLDEAGHYFLRYRADDLAQIVTSAHVAMADGSEATLRPEARRALPAAPEPAPVPVPVARSVRAAPATVALPDEAPPPRAIGGGADMPRWWLHDVSRRRNGDDGDRGRAGLGPSLGRFAWVALGQLISITGSAVTEFAIPNWIYLRTGSLPQFAMFMALALVPGVVVAPLAGAVVDRVSRRRVMIAAACAAGLVQLGLGLLVWTDSLQTWHFYPTTAALSVAVTFQRLAFVSAVPQLVPKRYLGHANGVVQMVLGIAQFTAPLGAVWLLSVVGLGGILVIDVVSFAAVITVVAAVRFPATMPHARREPLGREIVNGFRYATGLPAFRAMLGYFAVLNAVLAPLLLVVSPLVLSFADLTASGRVAFVGGLGAAVGGLVMALWGGPGERRMRGVLLCTLAMAVFAAVMGTRPSVPVVALGAFGMYFWLAVLNGIYTTIVLVKVPQRFTGRVFALNQMIAWSTLPLGFGVIAPLGQRLFDPLLAPGGALSSNVGRLIGVGEGRGIGFMCLVLGVCMAGLALTALRLPALARFDDDVPDAIPDDLIGLEALHRREG